MTVVFENGNTKVMNFGDNLRGLHNRGSRPVNVQFTIRDMKAALTGTESHIQTAQRYLREQIIPLVRKVEPIYLPATE